MSFFRQLVLFVVFCDCVTKVIPVTIVNEVTCDYNPKKCTGGFCKILNSRGSMKYVSTGCYIIKPIDSLELHIALLRKERTTYSSVIKPMKADFCNLENAKFENYYLSRVVAMTAKSLGVKCPLKGNISYPRIPLFLHFTQGLFPVGQYLIVSQANQQKEYFVKMNFSFAIKKNDFF